MSTKNVRPNISDIPFDTDGSVGNLIRAECLTEVAAGIS